MLSATRCTKRKFCLLTGFLILFASFGFAQDTTTHITLKGQILESGTGLPLEQVMVSVSATGAIAETDDQGQFEVPVSGLFENIVINRPGYTRRELYLSGHNDIVVYLVQSEFYAIDNDVVLPLQTKVAREITLPVSTITGADIDKRPTHATDALLQGLIPGLHVVRHSGFPGHKSWLSIGGVSSIYANTQPLLVIDGMIHEYNYADQSVIDGFTFNPWDVVDAEDIANVSVLKGSLASWGSNGSNGIIYVNTEQRDETSSQISFSAYGGVGLMPVKIPMLNNEQFRRYFSEQLTESGENPADYPWLQGEVSDEEYYRYNNNTDWQDLLFKPSSLQKYHIFLKGGDEIATYNISTGFLKHGSIYENSAYSRYNLRINGKINITDKFSVVPNVKLSLSDSYLASMGAEDYKNPLTSALLKSPLMAPMARDPETGVLLNELDDVGVFNVSNPVAIVEEGMGTNRNYHFLSSIDFRYQFSQKLMVSSLTGISYNNSRESLFVPDHGLVNQEFADNSRHDLVYDFRSTQNHSKISYSEDIKKGLFEAILGFRYMKNSYKYNEGNDLNTASDDFRNLGQGAKYQYLRTTLGDDRELIWASFYGVFNYTVKDKYYMVANISHDGNSNINKNNRYNLYPSLGVAWRLSSEPWFSETGKIGDLKLRGSYGISGNMHSYAYDYSKLFYVGRRLGETGVLVRDAVPNTNLEIERKSTANIGVDFSTAHLKSNFVVNYYFSTIGNLLINQQLPTFGFENYFDNGGVLNINAIEFSYNGRTHASNLIWTYGFSISRYRSKVKNLHFLDDAKEFIIHDVTEINDIRVQYITRENQGLNLFYGYETDKTDLLYTNDQEAQTVTGPGGIPMQAGDVRYVDHKPDGVINSEDKTVIGDPNPDFYGGIHTALIYKNIELAALFTYAYGNDIFNYTRQKTEAMDQFYNQTVATGNRWTEVNGSDDMPRASYGDPTGNAVFSDRWIEDGSYFRLKDLTISYTIPGGAKQYQDINIYVTASNLLTFTNYTGYDPENYYENSPYQMGIDYGNIPQIRTVLIGLKLSL
jgi:TonB-linked SusC/RagA family outer membrane protein